MPGSTPYLSRIFIHSIVLITAAWLGLASQASAQIVSLSVAPGSAIQTMIDVTTAFGSDSDGPTPVDVTGVADAIFTTEVDPVHGLVVNSFAFTTSDLTFADTNFQVTIFVPIDISLVGIEGVFSTDVLAPGLGVSTGTSEFNVEPLEIEWTAGEIVVLDPPGIPAANTIFPLQGTAVISAAPNGPAIDLTVTIPVSSVDTVTEDDVTVTTTLSGTLTLIGTYAPSPVPSLEMRVQWGLVAFILCLGTAALRPGRVLARSIFGTLRRNGEQSIDR